MTRRRVAIALAAGGAALLTCALYWLLAYQPAFYRAELANSLTVDERLRQSKPFTQAAVQLVDRVRRDERWSQQFTEQSVNAWLAAELPHRYADWLPAGVEQPRVRFEDEILRVAFQTRRGLWKGVVSARLRVWAPAPNQLACEIQSLLAGLIPIPAETLLEDLVEDLNRADWSVEWKPAENADVLLVHFDRDAAESESDAAPVLEAVEVARGRLRVTGGRQRAAVATKRGVDAVSQAEDDADSGVK